MSLFSLHLLIYLASFILVWIGSGLVVSTISSLARSWRLPTFTLSFFLLGIMTSLPEITIGTLAVLSHDPGIFVGNLLGGTLVIFLLIIPLLGLTGKGISLPKSLSARDISLILIVVLTPMILTADQKLTPAEGLIMLVLYGVLFIYMFKEQSLAEKISSSIKKKQHHQHPLMRLAKTVLGIGLLLGASHQIIQSTFFFAQELNLSSFFVSLIVVALGTNVPEFSLILRSMLNHSRQIALADYLGSAAANTLIMGALSLFYGQTIMLPNHFWQRFVFLSGGLVLFFIFAKTKRQLSRLESFILLICYLGFMAVEFLTAA